MSNPLYAVYGASGCGRGIMPLADLQLKEAGVPANRIVFIDDGAKGGMVNGKRILKYEEFLQADASERFVALAIANGKIRMKLATRCAKDGIRFWSIRASNMVIMDDVTIGEGALLSPFVTLTSNIRIGRHFHANLYSYVEHDCLIGDFVTFAPGVKCNGNVIIEDYAYIGAGAILRQGVPGKPLVIGAGAIIGMGAIVTRDVPAGITVVGNPARPLIKD